MLKRIKVLLAFSLVVFVFYSPVYGKVALAPYLLPINHHLAEKLDQIFEANDRVTLNADSLKKAGFKILVDGKRSEKREGVYLLSHPTIKGYLIKLYTDNQRVKKKVNKYRARVQKSRVANQIINDRNYQSFLKVPKKWVYQYPRSVTNKESGISNPQQTVLVVENMQIINQQQNSQMWKSELVTPEILDAVYTIVRGAGLKDLQTSNIPFRKDGKLCFVDLEQHGWKCRYKHLGKRLSPEMRCYWMSLFRREKELKRSSN